MTVKKISIVSLVFVVVLALVGVVSAQEDTTTTPQRGRFGGRGIGFHPNSEVILEATGLTQEELFEALQSGSTLADLITANDGDVDAVIAELVQTATDHINQHIEDGKLTQEQADTMLAELETRITERINGTFEPPMMGKGGNSQPPFGRGRGPRGGFEDQTPPDAPAYQLPDDTTTDDASSDDA